MRRTFCGAATVRFNMNGEVNERKMQKRVEKSEMIVFMFTIEEKLMLLLLSLSLLLLLLRQLELSDESGIIARRCTASKRYKTGE